MRMERNDEGGADEETLQAALTILAALYPPEARERVRRNFLAAMARDFAECGMDTPQWLLAEIAEG